LVKTLVVGLAYLYLPSTGTPKDFCALNMHLSKLPISLVAV
jgi:hypothetical protein